MKHSIGSGRNRFWSNAKSMDKNPQISPLNTPFVISNTVDMKQVLIICGTIFFGFGSTGYFIHTQLKSNYAETKKDNENRDASFEKRYTESKELQEKRYTESKEIQEKRYTESKEYNNKRDADFDKKYSEFKEFNERRYTESKEYDRKRDADLDKKYTEFTDLVKNKLR
jgi:hypothetical protein